MEFVDALGITLVFFFVVYFVWVCILQLQIIYKNGIKNYFRLFMKPLFIIQTMIILGLFLAWVLTKITI